MTVTDPTQAESSSAPASGLPASGGRSWFKSFFGGSKTSSAPARTETKAHAESGNYVIAPGGYRIRVPHETDVHKSIGEMLPTVRQGLALIPPLPRAVTELMREIQDPNATATSVGNIAASDPSLAASLIRTVNSAAFGLHRKITSVAEAVSYLGFSSVKSLVLRLQLDQTLGGKVKANDDIEDLWIHCLVVSYIADALAKRVPGVDRGFVSTLGLLHDIGKLVIQTQFPYEAAQLREARGDGRESLIERETRILGVDHAELGATLAGKWDLPGDLVKAIRWHHAPACAFEPGDPKALHQAMSVLHIADQLAKYCYVYGDETEIDAVTPAAFDAVGFDHELTALLDTEVRAAASRAIFFADDGSSRSATSIRRFLRLNRGPAATQLLASIGQPQSTNTQVKVDDALCAALFEPGAGVSRFNSSSVTQNIQKLAREALEKLATLSMSNDSQMAMSLIARCLIANAVGKPPEKIEIAIGDFTGRVRFALRAPALGFANRFGADVEAGTAAFALDSELANVLNLGWFESIAVSSDGTTLVFTARAG